jgi:hypothetical protein
MNAIKFIINQNITSTSTTEQIGDFILTPAHLIWGKKFVYFPTEKKNIEIVQDSILLQKITIKTGPWLKTALKVISLPFIVLLPLGLLIKSLSLMSSNTRHTYSLPVETLTRDNLSREIYSDVAQNPLRYFQYVPGCFFSSSRYTFTPLGVSECACNNEAFNRLTSPHRMQLEERLVQDLMSLISRKQPPRILSIGCGSLLSEFRFIGLLLAAGHTEIDLDLIDPMHTDALDNLKQFYKQLGISVRMNWYSNMKVYKKVHSNANLDALFAMDYDEMVDNDGAAAKDFMDARKHLTPEAKAYLGFSGACVISKDNEYELLNTSGVIQEFIYAFDNELANFNKPTLQVAIPLQAPRSLEFLIAVTEWVKKKKISNLEITFIKPEGSVHMLARNHKNDVLIEWKKNCISDSLQIKAQEGEIQKNFFDLLGPRCFFREDEPVSNKTLKKIITPEGVALTLTQTFSGAPRLIALSHNSERVYTMQ